MVNNSCAFCPVEKRTRWWYEDDVCLLIDKPNGEPMVLVREHTDEPSEVQLEHCHEVASEFCGEHEFQVLMHHVEDHWHAHIVEYDEHPEENHAPIE